MTPENTSKLIALFPQIFSYPESHHGPSVQPFRMFRFECNDGWFELLKELILQIKKYCEKNGHCEVKVAQVKEKFGSLRFYVDYAGDEIDDMIHEAEKKSSKTCEN